MSFDWKLMSYKNLFDLTGKTALVTGARKGIGFALASALADFGADIIAVSSHQTPDDDLAKYVNKLGRNFTSIQCDLRNRAETLALCTKVRDLKIDILINNAGLANRGEVLVHNDEIWDDTIEIDLTAPFILSREIGKGMAARGGGKIIFIASMWSYQGGKNVISYTAAKTALVGLIRGMSNELLSKGITVNGIAPGFIDTEITKPLKDDPVRLSAVNSRIPFGRWGLPADLAGAAVFLASPAADYVSGVVLPVDGGYLAS